MRDARIFSRPLLKAGNQPRVRSAPLLDEPAPSRNDVKWLLPAFVSVHVATQRFIRFPHSRTSADTAELGLQETERLTHEAEIVRGIDPGQAELLAVFPSVPIEIVSRVRFVPGSSRLLYTLLPKPDVTRTRVHQLVAVRDRKTGETHLVPHRTRYRMAFLT